MKTVLICDDEPLIRMSLKAMLKELGFEDVLECGDGKSAVEMAMASFPDMAVLDVAMPEMDGIAFLREVNKSFPGSNVIMITAYGGVESYIEAINLGAFEYINKPVRIEELKSIMGKIFSSSTRTRRSPIASGTSRHWKKKTS